MQDLTLVGVSDDGEHLVLSGADGQRFRVRVDEPMRAAVRRDRARLGQLQIEMDGRLRPRDIQARIRAGHTAQEVAEEAGLPLEHVSRFEGPVLAEREFVARQARGVRVRRAGAGAHPTLGDLVGERLARRDVDDDAAVWDAYRRDDGQWVVTLTFPAGGRTRAAAWTFDPQLRHVVPLDDESRWLTEDDAPEPGALPPGARRLAPVPDPLRPGRGRDVVYDVESDAAVRPAADAEPPVRATEAPAAAAARAERPDRERPLPEAPVPTSATSGQAAMSGQPGPTGQSGATGQSGQSGQSGPAGASTVDLLDSLRERRGRRPRPVPGEEQALLSREDVADPDVLRLPDTEADAAAGDPPPAEVDVTGDEPLPRAAGAGAANERPGRKNRRASVPSWDDIVFGSRRE